MGDAPSAVIHGAGERPDGAGGPPADVLAEAWRVAGAIEDAGLHLRFAGGLGIAMTCPSALRPPLAREYGDLDLAGRRKDHRLIVSLLHELGYVEDVEFNALNSDRRLLLHDPVSDRPVDVFLERAELCHDIDLRDRVRLPGPALTPADLLLMKLQVFETTRKDLTDIIAILVDHPMGHGEGEGVDVEYLACLAAKDWGLWRTTTMVARRAAEFARELEGFEHADIVAARTGEYLAALDAAPKSRAWRLRHRVGDKKRWYELPEEKD
ncbi:MAG: hypothetical protein QOD44_813 [Solirubrobacteraceae bacterium]|jgi:hypothetical protein|nr:hypothetical protein [Solirubrobacteraceae bacterium]